MTVTPRPGAWRRCSWTGTTWRSTCPDPGSTPVGLARRKVDDQIRLTSGHAIDAGTRKPRVYYKLLERRDAGGRTAFVYRLTIRPEGAGKFSRKLLIRVRREEAGWRVSNYMEY